jgi:hypothetical protein
MISGASEEVKVQLGTLFARRTFYDYMEAGKHHMMNGSALLVHITLHTSYLSIHNHAKKPQNVETAINAVTDAVCKTPSQKARSISSVHVTRSLP